MLRLVPSMLQSTVGFSMGDAVTADKGLRIVLRVCHPPSFFCYHGLHKETRVLFWWLCRWSVLVFHCFFLKCISLASRHFGCFVKLCPPCFVHPSSHCDNALCSPNVNLVILSSSWHILVARLSIGLCCSFWPVLIVLDMVHVWYFSLFFIAMWIAFPHFSVLLSSLYIWPCLSSNDSYCLEF